MSDSSMKARKARRLSPSEKCEKWLAVVTGQATQREAAERYGVDRSTVVHTCRVAKQGELDALASSVPGRAGLTAEQVVRIDTPAGAGLRVWCQGRAPPPVRPDGPARPGVPSGPG